MGTGGYENNVYAYTLTISCNHCDDSIYDAEKTYHSD